MLSRNNREEEQQAETTIIVPGAFTSGTNHFAHAGSPEDKARLKEYESGPTAILAKEIMKDLSLQRRRTQMCWTLRRVS